MRLFASDFDHHVRTRPLTFNDSIPHVHHPATLATPATCLDQPTHQTRALSRHPKREPHHTMASSVSSSVTSTPHPLTPTPSTAPPAPPAAKTAPRTTTTSSKASPCGGGRAPGSQSANPPPFPRNPNPNFLFQKTPPCSRPPRKRFLLPRARDQIPPSRKPRNPITPQGRSCL